MIFRAIKILFVAVILLATFGCSTTELQKAVIKGDITGAQVLLKNGANINETDSRGKTPLICAIENNQLQAAKSLVDWGANINIKDNKGYSALFYAIYFQNKEAVDYLLKKGADVNARDKSGGTPLHYAAIYCDPNIEDANLIIDYLLASNPDVGIRDSSGQTALYNALSYKNIDLVAGIRKKSNWSERIWFETPFAYPPEARFFMVPDEQKKSFEYALNDCSIMLNKSVSYSEKNFIACMNKMGFVTGSGAAYEKALAQRLAQELALMERKANTADSLETNLAPGNGLVYIVREPYLATGAVDAHIVGNGKTIVILPSDNYFLFSAPAGEIKFSVAGLSVVDIRNGQRQEQLVKLKAGETVTTIKVKPGYVYYIKVAVFFTGGPNGYFLTQVPYQDGADLIKKYKLTVLEK